jgi:hypothetical protein
MRAPDWNSLCWLVERDREEKERRKVVLVESKIDSKTFGACPL